MEEEDLATLDAEVADGRASNRSEATPITSTIRGLTSEVRVGPRNGLDAESVISCENITTVRKAAVGETIGLLFDDQEFELGRAIGDAFDLTAGGPPEAHSDDPDGT